jgi:hypothetical protein
MFAASPLSFASRHEVCLETGEERRADAAEPALVSV